MSSSEWKTYKLVELGKLARGKSRHRPRDASFLYGGPYPFIQTGDIKSANHKIRRYTQTYSEKGLAQSKLWPEGTIVITIAANIADTAILTFPACFPDSVLGFVANTELCDIEFVEYLLQHYKKQIQSHAVGSVQDNINLGTFENVEFDIPPLPIQKRIAAVLSALDEKIELNRQTNATLEAIAQAIFREWFVNFNYPVLHYDLDDYMRTMRVDGENHSESGNQTNHSTDMVEGEMGLMPAGWRVGVFQDLMILQRGFDLSTDKRIAGHYPVIAASGPSGTHKEFKVKGPGVTTGRSGVLGKVFYSHDDFWPLNTSLWVKSFVNPLCQYSVRHSEP